MPKKKVRITAIPPEDAAISNYLMQKNLDKNFVQRAYEVGNIDQMGRSHIPSGQSIQIPGMRGRSTHLMAYDPNSQRVYPEVVQQNGQLKHLQGDDAWDYADSTGEYIQMPPSEKVMDMFSNYGYKHASGIPIYKNGGTKRPPIYVDSPNDPRYRAYQDSLDAYNTGEKYNRLNRLYGQNGEYYKTPHKPAGRKHIEGMSFGEENLPENYYSAKGLPIADISKYYNNPDNFYRRVQDEEVAGEIWNVSAGMKEVKKWSNAFDSYRTLPEKIRVVPDKEAYLFLPQYKQPIQPIVVGQQIDRLPTQFSNEPYSPSQVLVPPFSPKIQDDGWYSNKVGVPIDVEDTSPLYNEDGSRKYNNEMKYGGTMTKRKIQVVGVPQYAIGGEWASQRGNAKEGYALYTPWPISAYQQYETAPDYRMKNTIPKNKEDDYRDGEEYDVDEYTAEKLRKLGYEFEIL